MSDLSMLQDFIAESMEHLEEMESNLLQLEGDTGQLELLNDIFRSIHTIKGSSEYLGMENIATLAHRMENLLDRLRKGEKEFTDDIFDVFIEARDRIAALVKDVAQTQSEQTEIDDLLDRIDALSDEPAEDKKESADEFEEDYPDLDEDEFMAEIESMIGDVDPVFEQPEDEEQDQAENDNAKQIETRVLLSDEPDSELMAEVEGDDVGDKELFEIFTGQLQESISLLNAHLEAMPEAESRKHQVDECIACIRTLRSSANYMGYEKFTEFYEQWIDAIRAVQADVAQNNKAVSGFIQTVMQPHIQHLMRLFPQLRELKTDFSEIKAPVTEEGGKEDVSKKTSSKTAVEPKEETEIVHEIETESLDDGPDESALFQKLENAYETFGSVHMIDDFDDSAQVIGNELFSFDGEILAEKSADITPASQEGDTRDDDQIPPRKEPEEMLFSQTSAEITEKPKAVPTPEKDAATTQSQAMPATARSGSTADSVVKKSLRVDAKKIDYLMNQVGELVVSRAWFSQLYNEMRELEQFFKERRSLEQGEMKKVKNITFRLSEATVALGRVANELQEGVMRVRMLPISQLFNRYPRLVRDLTHDTDKTVRLVIKGEDTELDKMIIEEISDPLIHIIRNAVDHGIESAVERKRNGKSESGQIVLEAYHESNHVVIEIKDDGKGLDTDRIKEIALERGFCAQEELERMTIRDLTGLIMAPGFSTAAKITHTSGRGVGMDVVKKNIEKLNGTLEIDSKKGVYTQLRIKIPLTLAIIQALLVRVGSELYTIPLAAVEETLRIRKEDTSTIEGNEVIYIRTSTLPLVRLSELFDFPLKTRQKEREFVVIVSTGMKKIGLVVDDLIGQEEVVIKPMEDYLQENSGFSGATILGDGKISLILDVYELANLSINKLIRKRQRLYAYGLSDENLNMESRSAGPASVPRS
jgi:two-component system chemotaxis sensor kinase CheA